MTTEKFIIWIQLSIRIKLEAILCHLTDITQNYVRQRIYGQAKIKLDSKQVSSFGRLNGNHNFARRIDIEAHKKRI